LGELVAETESLQAIYMQSNCYILVVCLFRFLAISWQQFWGIQLYQPNVYDSLYQHRIALWALWWKQVHHIWRLSFFMHGRIFIALRFLRISEQLSWKWEHYSPSQYVLYYPMWNKAH